MDNIKEDNLDIIKANARYDVDTLDLQNKIAYIDIQIEKINIYLNTVFGYQKYTPPKEN